MDLSLHCCTLSWILWTHIFVWKILGSLKTPWVIYLKFEKLIIDFLVLCLCFITFQSCSWLTSQVLLRDKPARPSRQISINILKINWFTWCQTEVDRISHNLIEEALNEALILYRVICLFKKHRKSAKML